MLRPSAIRESFLKRDAAWSPFCPFCARFRPVPGHSGRMRTKTVRAPNLLGLWGLYEGVWRRGPGSNRRIKVLQTSPLPLGYRALAGQPQSMSNHHGIHPAKSTVAGTRLVAGGAIWSGRRDLNSRPSPWQGDALPLSYSRLEQYRVYRGARKRVKPRRRRNFLLSPQPPPAAKSHRRASPSPRAQSPRPSYRGFVRQSSPPRDCA